MFLETVGSAECLMYLCILHLLETMRQIRKDLRDMRPEIKSCCSPL